MTINSKFKSLLAVALFSSLSAVSAKDNDAPAPEATTADAATSFWDFPYLETAFIDLTPAERKDNIPVGELGVDGGNKDMILKLAQEIAESNHGKYDSLLIAHKDKLLFESYYLRGRVNLPHMQSSATKAYVSLAIGRAIQLGHLTMADLDKPLVSFLKDLDPTKFIEGAEKITLHKAMTMRSGLRISREQMKEFRKNPSKLKGQKQVQTFLENSPPVTTESQSFEYQDADPILVMQVLEAVVPGTAKDFIKNELFNKIGIASYDWRDDVSGLPVGSDGSKLTSRNMIKLGRLILNKGKWDGEQLISPDFQAQATSAITEPTTDWIPDEFSYGYFSYQTLIEFEGKSYQAKLAWGGGGQYILTFEDLDLTVVITGHDLEDKIMTQVAGTILPAFLE